MSAEIIIAMIALLGTLVSGIFQLSVYKSQAKKSSVEAEDILMNRAIELSKHEIDVLRLLNEDLKNELKAKDEEITKLKKKVQELSDRLSICEAKIK